jgi:hypothetical protein
MLTVVVLPAAASPELAKVRAPSVRVLKALLTGDHRDDNHYQPSSKSHAASCWIPPARHSSEVSLSQAYSSAVKIEQ